MAIDGQRLCQHAQASCIHNYAFSACDSGEATGGMWSCRIIAGWTLHSELPMLEVKVGHFQRRLSPLRFGMDMTKSWRFWPAPHWTSSINRCFSWFSYIFFKEVWCWHPVRKNVSSIGHRKLTAYYTQNQRPPLTEAVFLTRLPRRWSTTETIQRYTKTKQEMVRVDQQSTNDFWNASEMGRQS